ncbi:putative AlkP superfamily pyrophosphatase or phosphodiesterase [Roseimicrobium gellanilyticum]|uniref:Putative AlkP superfamily pyrophosphatase or phosphodiesterase n=1 Tax=Roseimicrobium gellanilyticum TaxID=748857 RepID=A0A366HR54_9BACT|nr:alkaline phosphatase family protein [Roseimicrobium gellanilyticum]RBP46132.1 putative AlkP superfamily pyrophosphatase or phosphodiesterase [Roseimicrobium gellanilyticum]
MHRRLSLLLAIGAVVLGFSHSSSGADSDRHVILISVDGLAHYYFEDPKAEMPTIRRLAAEGARAKHMTTSLPTVTWPNHTTLVTGVHAGKHGVIGNDFFDRKEQKVVAYIPDPVFNKDEIVKTPTIYDVVHDAGMSTAGICWPASRGAKSWDWTIPDVFDQATFEQYSTPSLLAECREAGIPFEKQNEWCKAGTAGKPMRDWLYANLACHIIRKHKPKLMCLHYMSVDGLQHGYGSKTPEAYWAINDSDNRIRQVVEAVEDAGLKDKTTFVVTADHGFITYKKRIQPNVLLKKEGLIKAALGNKVTERRVWCHAQGVAYIYILDQANRDALLKDLTPKLAALEGIEEVIEEKDFAKYGLETAAKDPRMPDLILSPKDGYVIGGDVGGDELVVAADAPKGAHGYSPANPLMDASFVISGAGIKKGVIIDKMANIDVAPTMAKLLGVEIKGADGRVLTEVLK